jgi:hypothetical protein
MDKCSDYHDFSTLPAALPSAENGLPFPVDFGGSVWQYVANFARGE